MAVAAPSVCTMVLASAAVWACTAFASMEISPQTGQAGTAVRVVGRNFTPGPVEVRWDSPSGAMLGTGTGPHFSISVTVPQSAAPGIYYVVAIQPNQGKASRTFEVTSSAAGGAGTQPQHRAASGDSSGATSGAEPGTTSERSATASTSSSDSTGSAPAPRQSGDATTSAPAEQTGVASPGGSPASGGDGGRERVAENSKELASRTAAARPTAGGNTTPSRSTQRNESPGTPAGTEEASSPAPAALAEADGVPTARTATGDLWGGFDAAPEALRGARLDASTSGPSSPSTVPLVAGLVLMGLASLAMGFVLGPLARRQPVRRGPG